MFGAILGAVSSVAGLFKKDKPQVQESHVDYKRMVKDSMAAGFNPLTALRNGGSAGFTTTTSHPALAGSDFIGRATDAAASIGNIFSAIDPNKNAREDLSGDLAAIQIGAAADDPWLRLRSSGLGGAPQYEAPQQFQQLSGVIGSKTPTAADRAGIPLAATVDRKDSTSPYDFIVRHPAWPPASNVEDEYSDLMGSVYGVAKTFADTQNTLVKRGFYDEIKNTYRATQKVHSDFVDKKLKEKPYWPSDLLRDLRANTEERQRRQKLQSMQGSGGGGGW